MKTRDIVLGHSFLIMLFWLSCAHAQENCKRPTPVDALGDIQSNYLALKSRNVSYAIDSPCIILDRQAFPKILSFFILPLDVGPTTTLIFIKSYRTFTNSPPDKIKVSRSDGWFFSDSPQGKAVIQQRLDDEPYSDTLVAWNSAHSTAGTPQEFKDRLKVIWHAYADEEKHLPSTRNPSYWKTKTDFDFGHGTLTAYLLRFPSNSKTPIPFNVYLQDAVQQIELTLDSNVEALSGEFKFTVQ